MFETPAYEIKLASSFEHIDSFVTTNIEVANTKYNEWREDRWNHQCFIELYEWQNGIRIEIQSERIISRA